MNQFDEEILLRIHRADRAEFLTAVAFDAVFAEDDCNLFAFFAAPSEADGLFRAGIRTASAADAFLISTLKTKISYCLFLL